MAPFMAHHALTLLCVTAHYSQPHQKVRVAGRFMHERSVFVGPRPRTIPGQGLTTGFFLVTPLYDPVK